MCCSFCTKRYEINKKESYYVYCKIAKEQQYNVLKFFAGTEKYLKNEGKGM